jgi:hypothetical protein
MKHKIENTYEISRKKTKSYSHGDSLHQETGTVHRSVSNETAETMDEKTIPLASGLVAIVDADDYDRLAQYKWHVYKSGRCYYARRYCSGNYFVMHHEIIYIPPGLVCDHINHDTLDNRKCNLRACTPSQNAQNRLPGNGGSSRYKGVCWHKECRKWMASICYNDDRIHIGLYDYEEDAAIAYDDKAIELFGEFACLNFEHRPEIRLWLQQCYLFSPIEIEHDGLNNEKINVKSPISLKIQ